MLRTGVTNLIRPSAATLLRSSTLRSSSVLSCAGSHHTTAATVTATRFGSRAAYASDHGHHHNAPPKDVDLNPTEDNTKGSTSLRKLGLYAGVALAVAGAYYLSQDMVDKENAELAKTAVPSFDSKNFKPFKLQEVQTISHDTKILRFALPTPYHKMGLPVASCILTKAPPAPGEEKPVIRPYTPISSDDDLGYFDLLVKVYPNGVMSRYLHSLKPGDELEVKGPISKIPYKPNMKKEIGMVAGGTGITPMYQVLKEILKNPEDKTQVSLIFANKSTEDILLKDELDNLAKKHPNFHIHYTVDSAPRGKWEGSVGYVTKEMIQQHLPGPSDDALIMVCGPPGFYKHVSGSKAPDYSQGELDGLLKELGWRKNNVFKF
ncbi:NADH-cytochrome b5 reductase [Balamuthia mandrillaris]